ncbi:MAG TPA: hypothetical protein DEF47_04980 [Herpetosiphon sp.]|uniref:hypothetical protein n=1 Tax=Herpetosiphon sp. TaxID=71864 RepID=UPI00059EA7FA|nr:hypothetical protein [Herpetosiphon sp.]HBW49236.1 hypothetical protein [Herpetosiphon sp.]
MDQIMWWEWYEAMATRLMALHWQCLEDGLLRQPPSTTLRTAVTTFAVTVHQATTSLDTKQCPESLGDAITQLAAITQRLYELVTKDEGLPIRNV